MFFRVFATDTGASGTPQKLRGEHAAYSASEAGGRWEGLSLNLLRSIASVGGKVCLYPLPRPERIAAARENSLRALGLSAMKASYLKAAAPGILKGDISQRAIESLRSNDLGARDARG